MQKKAKKEITTNKTKTTSDLEELLITKEFTTQYTNRTPSPKRIPMDGLHLCTLRTNTVHTSMYTFLSTKQVTGESKLT